MADTFTHGAATGWTAKIVGVSFYSFTGAELFSPAWLTVVVLGAILPDICTEPFCWWARHRNFGRGRSFLVSMKYDALLTEELEELEKGGSPAVTWYHLVHTYWAAGVTTALFSYFMGFYLASAWAVGYVFHIGTDEGMHRKFLPYLPFRGRAFTTDTNWWEWRWDLCIAGRTFTIWWSPHVYYASVPLALLGILHLVQLNFEA